MAIGTIERLIDGAMERVEHDFRRKPVSLRNEEAEVLKFHVHCAIPDLDAWTDETRNKLPDSDAEEETVDVICSRMRMALLEVSDQLGLDEVLPVEFSLKLKGGQAVREWLRPHIRFLESSLYGIALQEGDVPSSDDARSHKHLSILSAALYAWRQLMRGDKDLGIDEFLEPWEKYDLLSGVSPLMVRKSIATGNLPLDTLPSIAATEEESIERVFIQWRLSRILALNLLGEIINVASFLRDIDQ